jgi:hypothetical protein
VTKNAIFWTDPISGTVSLGWKTAFILGYLSKKISQIFVKFSRKFHQNNFFTIFFYKNKNKNFFEINSIN